MPRNNVVSLEEPEHKVPHYGTLLIGSTAKTPDGRFTAVCHKQTIGDFNRRKDAESAVIAYWHSNFSGASLEARFKDRTKGGFQIRFHHQFEDRIVARVYASSSWFISSWTLEGKIRLSDEGDRYDLLRR